MDTLKMKFSQFFSMAVSTPINIKEKKGYNILKKKIMLSMWLRCNK